MRDVRMFAIGHDAERHMPELLQEEGEWKSLHIDYETPHVNRLWRPWGEYRLFMHKIFPCERAFLHRHAWPAYMRLHGTYEMQIAYAREGEPKGIAATVIMHTGSEYVMADPDGFHAVRPLEIPSMSFMVTGSPWKGTMAPKSTKQLHELSQSESSEIFAFFRSLYV